MRFKCNEPVPDGYGIPEKWKSVKLGDVCEVVTAKRLPKFGKGGLTRKETP
jgi:restriction endonuclease S subunit